MREVELWAWRPGGPGATVANELPELMEKLIKRFGPEMVAQVAVLESGVLPVKRPLGGTNG